jgi:uncharacterized protein (DUF1778 family)
MAQAPRRESTRRRLINLRVSPEDRNVIDRAAKLAGKTRAEFMLEAARRAAQQALPDTTLLMVDSEAFNRFKTMRELMRRRAPWDHDSR